jgi:hypothetical protein
MASHSTGGASVNTYEHTQAGTLIVVLMVTLSIVFSILGATVAPPLLVAVPIVALSGWLFRSLTIEVDQCELRWWFGSGFLEKSVPLDEIVRAQPVRTNFLEGWGIHYSRFGWLYNVSGRDAVAITLKNGERFALGTDEADRLIATFKPATPKQVPPDPRTQPALIS